MEIWSMEIFESFPSKHISGRTIIIIFNFRVRFKDSDFCEGSVLRSLIFVKGPF